MKIKIAFAVLSFVLLTYVMTLFSSGISPEVTTSLALEQFENPSMETDTTMRVYERSSFYTLAYLGWAFLILTIFWNNISNVYSKLSTSEEESE